MQQISKEKDCVFLTSAARSAHWTYDTYALAHVAGKAMVERGEDSWFFITADYALGHALERDAADVVKGSGGRVLGAVKVPPNTADFSFFLLQARASGVKVVALANAGGDIRTAIKQAAEFGLQKGGRRLLALLIQITDTHSLGLAAAPGMILTTASTGTATTRPFASASTKRCTSCRP